MLNGQKLDAHEFPADLKARLLRVNNAFPMPRDEISLTELDEPVRHPAISATMDTAVFDLFHAYYAALHDMTDPRRALDDRLRGNYGRFPTMALKLALILAIMDGADAGTSHAPRVSTAHWARGQMLTEEYRASVHRLLDALIAVWAEELARGGRVEIEHFLVLEVHTVAFAANRLLPARRYRRVAVRASQALREKLNPKP